MPTGYVEKCYDHKGNMFPNKKARAAAYNLVPSTVKRRLDRGMSLKEALETPPDSRKNTYDKKRVVTDHLGNKFSSRAEMCRFYNITNNAYWDRIYVLHWSLEKTLTTPVKILKNKKFQIGYKGKASCGLSYKVVERRRNKGGTDSEIKVLFEDGEKSDFERVSYVSARTPTHPFLRRNKKCSYFGFQTKHLMNSYYKSECSFCGYKDILTPQQMIKHFKIHDE